MTTMPRVSASALTGRSLHHILYPGRCPGLSAQCPFRATVLSFRKLNDLTQVSDKAELLKLEINIYDKFVDIRGHSCYKKAIPVLSLTYNVHECPRIIHKYKGTELDKRDSLRAPTPLPCRGGAGVGSVIKRFTESYLPTPNPSP